MQNYKRNVGRKTHLILQYFCVNHRMHMIHDTFTIDTPVVLFTGIVISKMGNKQVYLILECSAMSLQEMV